MTLQDLVRQLRNTLYMETKYHRAHERQWESEAEEALRERYNQSEKAKWDAETERLIEEASTS